MPISHRTFAWIALAFAAVAALFFLIAILTESIPATRLMQYGALVAALLLGAVGHLIRSRRERLALVLSVISMLLSVAAIVLLLGR